MPTVKLGDIAIESKETFSGDKAGVPIVGLEHLAPNEVTLSNWNVDVDNTFTKMFRKGDVLFGRRRAYLKKAAVAPFYGVCSGDITVIRAKDDKLFPDLLPFIIQNDDFFDYAVGKSAGSLSPRVKWSHLQNYKLRIPDMDQQMKVAELLWSINDSRLAYQSLLIETDGLVKSQFVEMFGNGKDNVKNYPIQTLDKIADYWNGLTYKPRDVTQDGSGMLVLRSSNIQNGALSFEDNVRVSCNIKEKLIVQDDDILMCSRNGSATLVGKTALIKGLEEAMTFGAFMLIIRSKYYPYLKTYFDMPAFREQISTGTSTINQITVKMLCGVKLPVPDMNAVERYAEFLENTDKSKFALQDSLNDLNSLEWSVIRKELIKE
jgi:type I restriction enzyme S subunit